MGFDDIINRFSQLYSLMCFCVFTGHSLDWLSLCKWTLNIVHVGLRLCNLPHGDSFIFMLTKHVGKKSSLLMGSFISSDVVRATGSHTFHTFSLAVCAERIFYGREIVNHRI